MAGRGAGKTRSGAEWIRDKVKQGSRHLGLIAPTAADIRKVMVEGESGVLACSWDKDVDNFGQHMGRPEYEPSKSHRLTWENGATAHCFSAEEPDRLRGPQHDTIWADELAAWKDMKNIEAVNAWDMALFGLRLGANPQALITTTPRPIPVIREMLRSEHCVVTHSTTYANRANLAAAFLSVIIAKYKGTRLGRQELEALILDELEGALWTRQMIQDALLVNRSEPDYLRTVVAVDPATTDKAASNLTGLIGASLGVDRHGYVRDDRSGRYSPDKWGRVAIQMYDDLQADCIVAEGNQGGDMVRHTIQTAAVAMEHGPVPVQIVHASRSKQARAEPVSALYEQKRIHHVKPFPELEDQLCTWEPLSGDPSPDRLDGLVWGITNLMLGSPIVSIVVPIVTGTPRIIPGQ